MDQIRGRKKRKKVGTAASDEVGIPLTIVEGRAAVGQRGTSDTP